MKTAEHVTRRRVLTIYLAGLLAGVQSALYLFDLYDDGVASARSGVIALVLIALGISLIARTFRGSGTS